MIGFNLQLLLVSEVCLDGSCECLFVDVFIFCLASRMKRSVALDVLHEAHNDVYLWALLLQPESDSSKKYIVYTAQINKVAYS